MFRSLIRFAVAVAAVLSTYVQAAPVTLAGAIASIAPPSIVVAGRSVTLDSSTVVTRGCAAASLASLAVGDFVTVTGELQADGSVLATSVADGACVIVPFSGVVEALSAASITVGAISMSVDASSAISRGCAVISLSDLRVGEVVAGGSERLADGSVRVVFVAAGGCTASGAITAIGPDSVVVAAQAFAVDASTRIAMGCSAVTLADLRVGDIVTADGVPRAGNSPLALSIQGAGACTFSGFITAIAATTLQVGARQVSVDALTSITRGCTSASLADLRVGDLATVLADVRGDGSLVAHSIVVGSCTAFSSFTARLEVDGGKFGINGDFALGAASNGIDPAHEALSLVFGGVAVSLPPGSLRAKGTGRWTFEGSSGGIALEVELRFEGGRTYSLKVEGSGANLAGVANPTPVSLTLGDDRGTATARVER